MANLYDRFSELGLPNYMLKGTMRYIVEHRRAGGFLMALFSNDLMRAVAHADTENSEALSRWVQFLYNYCPARSFGSTEAVEAWITEGE